MPESRLDEAAFLGVRQMLLDDLRQLGQRGGRLLVLGDPGPHADHVRERPVRDALAVGEAATPVPVGDLRQAVEVLVELPGQPGLADPGDADDRHEVRLPLVGAGVEEILDPAQLAVPAHEGRLQAGRLERPAGPGDDTKRLPERDEADLPLQLVRPRVRVDDCLIGRAAGRLADEHIPRRGDGLDPGRGVDEVAGDHALTLGSDRHRGLAREHACPRPKLGHGNLVAEGGHGRDQVERRSDRTLGVVLGRGRRAPDRHHRVADELLDRPAVELDQPPARVEVAREQLAGVLRVATLGR